MDIHSTVYSAGGMDMDPDEFARRFGKLPDHIRKALTDELKKETMLLDREVVTNLSGTVLKRRTGKLAQSVNWRIYESEMTGVVGASMIYARIHEYGGTIVPKTKKWLTIPLAAFGKAARNIPAAPNVQGLKFFIKPGANRGVAGVFGHGGLVGGKRGERIEAKGEWTPLFLLRKSVKIPARRPFSIALQHREINSIRAFSERMKKTLEDEGVGGD